MKSQVLAKAQSLTIIL